MATRRASGPEKARVFDFGLRIGGSARIGGRFISKTIIRLSRIPMPNELREEIKAMLVEELNLKFSPQEIADEMPLFGPDSLGLDSIDALQIAVSLEKNYGVKLPSSEVAKEALASVNSLHDFVLANRPA